MFANPAQLASQITETIGRTRAILEYGDYTGLDFHNNVFYPVWADNSNSTGDNANGTRAATETYYERLALGADDPR